LRLELTIDPLHPDGLGGVSVFGYLSIRTTLILASGALIVPLQLQYAIETGPLTTAVIYLLEVVYSLAIAGSFLYPTVVVYRRANELRESAIDELRTQYARLKRQSGEPRHGASLDSTDDEVEIKLQRIRQEHRDLRRVRLYPLDPSIFIRLLGSVLLPLAFIVVDTLLRPDTLQRLLSLLV